MFQPIIDDVKRTFQSGNMVSKLIVINVAVFLFVLIVGIFLKQGNPNAPAYQWLINNLAVSSEGITILTKPWTLITHMFLHEGLWHLAWNMLLFYWFGRIVGDFIGDRKILPIYILGGLAGIICYFVAAKVGVLGASTALGASAAVMAVISTAACLSPNYMMRLLIIGDVSIKYIVLFLIIMDLVGISNLSNTGGHIAHLGGVGFGALYVYLIRQGYDLADAFNEFINQFKSIFKKKEPKPKKSPLTVKHSAVRKSSRSSARGSSRSDSALPFEEKLDQILDKIKSEGYENLSDEEKEFLFQASKR